MNLNHFVLDVTHIGEEFVSLLCNTDAGKVIIKEIVKKQLGDEDFELTSALPNQDIEIGGKHGDAKSQIDVALIGKSCCYAVELKLGNAICTPGGYCQNYLNKTYSPGKKRFSGKMIPILSRMGMEEMDPKPEIYVLLDNDPARCQIKKTVNTRWILMVRTEAIVKKLKKENFKAGSENQKRWKAMRGTCTIVSLGTFLCQLKDKGLMDNEVEDLIKECITPPDTKTYIESWKISE